MSRCAFDLAAPREPDAGVHIRSCRSCICTPFTYGGFPRPQRPANVSHPLQRPATAWARLSQLTRLSSPQDGIVCAALPRFSRLRVTIPGANKSLRHLWGDAIVPRADSQSTAYPLRGFACWCSDRFFLAILYWMDLKGRSPTPKRSPPIVGFSCRTDTKCHVSSRQTYDAFVTR